MRFGGKLRSIGQPIVAILLASVALYFSARWVANEVVPYPLCLVVVVAVWFGYHVVQRVRPPSTYEGPIREDSDARGFGQLPDRPFVGVRRWEDMLELTRGDAAYFQHTVRPEILALLDERARLTGVRYDIADLGPRLSAVLSDTDPPRRPPAPNEFAAAMTELEELWKNRP